MMKNRGLNWCPFLICPLSGSQEAALKKKKSFLPKTPWMFQHKEKSTMQTLENHLCHCAVLHQYIHQCLHTLIRQFVHRQITELQLKFTSYSVRVERLNWKSAHYFQSKRTAIVRIYKIILLSTHNKRLSYGHVEYGHSFLRREIRYKHAFYKFLW